MSLWVVVGGQYGSEGKGKVSAFITKQEDIDICVRCGGPNSGHSFMDDAGKTVMLRQLPTGFVNPRARLLIPAGALIDPEIVRQEIELLGLSSDRVGIDRNSFIIEEKDRDEERRLMLRERLSSTLCGVGSAQARRILRGEDATLTKYALKGHPWLSRFLTDVSDEVNVALDDKRKVLIEGTQGFGLSLYHSNHYPYTTSRDTTASSFLTEVGVSPRLVSEIVVVFRTFPIRVAGMQAGPLQQEITWEDIQRESGYPYPIAEYTTVTRKIRRVARFDWEVARSAVSLNRPTRIAVMGLDYLDHKDRGKINAGELGTRSVQFISHFEKHIGKIAYAGTGPGLNHLCISTNEQRLPEPGPLAMVRTT